MHLAKATIADARSVVTYVWTHPGNKGKRLRALLRSARFQIRGRILRQRTLARLGNESYVWAYLHRTAASKIVYGNPPDYPEMLVWRRHLQPGDLFIDVGANVGGYTIWAAESGAHVIALEPASETFALLTENIALNSYTVDTVQAAAGRVSGTALFTSGLDSVNHIDPCGSVEIKVVTIDSVIGDRTVAGMKVDVEGFEIEVLLGSSRALAEHRIKLLQLEWNAASLAAAETDRGPIADLLIRHGYGLYRPDSSGLLVRIDDVGFGADVFACPAS